MVAPRKKATPAKKAAAQLAKNQPGRLRKARLFEVLTMRPNGHQTVYRVTAATEQEATAKVEAMLAEGGRNAAVLRAEAAGPSR